MKTRQLLLCTDLVRRAPWYFESVAAVAKLLDAKVTLLHVALPTTVPQQGARLGSADYSNSSQLSLSHLSEALGSEFEFSTHVLEGDSIQESICAFADERSVDLIALSTHGRKGLRRLALGSIAEGVLRKCKQPVLCFPRRRPPKAGKLEGLRHALIACDLSSDALEPFEPIIQLAKQLGCKLTALHVVPELLALPYAAPYAPPLFAPEFKLSMQRASERMQQLCQELESELDLEVLVRSHVNPASGIIDYATRHGVDVIALASHGHSGFQRFAQGSVSEEVMRKSPLPVLSFHRR